MSDYSVRICRVQNGFEVSLSDPEIVKANNKRSTGNGALTPWKDPDKKYAFKDMATALSFVEKTAELALPKETEKDTYDTAYDKAAKEAMLDGKEEAKETTK